MTKIDIRNLIIDLKKDNFEKPIINKLLYLIDWKHTLVYGEQLTNANWIWSNNGATFELNNKDLDYYLNNLNKNSNYFEENNDKDIVRKNIFIDFMKEKTERLLYTDFANMYFSTYPFIIGHKYDELNLEKSRNEYLQYLTNSKSDKINDIFGIRFENQILSKIDLEEYLNTNYENKLINLN